MKERRIAVEADGVVKVITVRARTLTEADTLIKKQFPNAVRTDFAPDSNYTDCLKLTEGEVAYDPEKVAVRKRAGLTAEYEALLEQDTTAFIRAQLIGDDNEVAAIKGRAAQRRVQYDEVISDNYFESKTTDEILSLAPFALDNTDNTEGGI